MVRNQDGPFSDSGSVSGNDDGSKSMDIRAAMADATEIAMTIAHSKIKLE